MKCPTCKDVVLSISDRSGIEIDFCPECRGVWLDRGELDKIIEKSNALESQNNNNKSTQTFPQPQYSQENIFRNDYKHKRKKSFLEEIFD